MSKIVLWDVRCNCSFIGTCSGRVNETQLHSNITNTEKHTRDAFQLILLMLMNVYVLIFASTCVYVSFFFSLSLSFSQEQKEERERRTDSSRFISRTFLQRRTGSWLVIRASSRVSGAPRLAYRFQEWTCTNLYETHYDPQVIPLLDLIISIIFSIEFL